jgi:ribosomal-protein-alanine N-acetyltransferase
VHPQHRRKGYGRILLIELLTSAYQRGLEWATLEVRPSNQAAVQLYEGFGFETVGRRRRYYQDDGEDALILWHKGLQTPAFQVRIEKWRSQMF